MLGRVCFLLTNLVFWVSIKFEGQNKFRDAMKFTSATTRPKSHTILPMIFHPIMMWNRSIGRAQAKCSFTTPPSSQHLLFDRQWDVGIVRLRRQGKVAEHGSGVKTQGKVQLSLSSKLPWFPWPWPRGLGSHRSWRRVRERKAPEAPSLGKYWNCETSRRLY